MVSQGTSVGKEKEGDLLSARVVYSVARLRFSHPLVSSLFHHQRHDLEMENPDPHSSGVIAQCNTPLSGNLWAGFHHGLWLWRPDVGSAGVSWP